MPAVVFAAVVVVLAGVVDCFDLLVVVDVDDNVDDEILADGLVVGVAVIRVRCACCRCCSCCSIFVCAFIMLEAVFTDLRVLFVFTSRTD